MADETGAAVASVPHRGGAEAEGSEHAVTGTPDIAPSPDRPPVPEPPAMDAEEAGNASHGAQVYRSVHTSPYLLRMAAGWSWRVLVVSTAIYLLLLLLVRLRVAVGAFIAALLLAALLMPVVHLLRRLRLPRAACAGLTVVLLLGVLAGSGALLGSGIAGQFDDLRNSVTRGIDQLTDYGQSLGLTQERIGNLQQQATDAVSGGTERLVSGALTATTVAAEVLSGLVLALFTLFFFLKDGTGMWAWVVRLFTARLRGQVDQAGQRAWNALSGYMRGIVVIALADAVLVAAALLVLDVPLVLPLALVTFLGAFVPIVGAFVSGFLAILVALVFNDPVTALLVAVAYVLVQQVEGNLLHPVVMRRAVALHPLVTVVAVTAGATLAGIAGAIVSVPIAALVNVVVLYLAGQAALVRRTMAETEALPDPAEPAYPVLALMTGREASESDMPRGRLAERLSQGVGRPRARPRARAGAQDGHDATTAPDGPAGAPAPAPGAERPDDSTRTPEPQETR